MLNKKTLTTLLLLCFCQIAIFAQEEEKEKLSISGSVDVYYQTLLTADDRVPQPHENGSAFGTSFADQTGFALGMANIIASYETGKVGAVADVAFGNRALSAVGGGRDVFVNQLYAYLNVSEDVTLTMGRFNTFLGYEVISPTGNFNYSTSYMFSSGPFSHVGLKADIALSDDFSLMLAIMNLTDENVNATGDYALGLQLGYSDQFLNIYYDNGAKLGFEIDYTGGFDVTEEFFLGINAAYQTYSDYTGEDIFVEDLSNGFYGIALYPQYTLSDDFALGLRGEYFGYHVQDAENLSSVLGLTLTGSYEVENLTIKPEIRLDSWSNATDVYLDNDGAAADSLASFVLAAVYKF